MHVRSSSRHAGCLAATRRWLTASRHPRLSKRAQLSAGGGAAEIWRKVNALAAQEGMLNMGQGFPDFAGSGIARAAAQHALDDASMNQYSPQAGKEDLRNEISRFYRRRYGAVLDPATEIVVTSSGQEALSAAFHALLDPGDEVVIFEPFYPFLLGAIELAGAVPRFVRLSPPEFTISVDAVNAAVNERTRMIVHNSPHNPTGHVSSDEEMAALAGVCIKKDLLMMSDEVYEHCVFPPRQHKRIADLPGMLQRTVTISSAGKLFSLTGWRVAWASGPPHLMAPINFAHTHLTYCAPTPLQAGIAAALKEEDGAFGGVGQLFGENFVLLSDAIERGTGATTCGAQGGYFLVADVSGSGASSDMAFCEKLAQEKGVVCTPMSVFYSTHTYEGRPRVEDPCKLVRFTVCKSRDYIGRVCRALLAVAK